MTMLLVLSETLRLRKLTLVAKRLGLTQSAISHSLARLRDVFGDPLFLRRPHGLEPTARALELELQVSAILALVQESVEGPRTFDPATAQRWIRIAALDYVASLIAAPLCLILEDQAPGLRPMIRAEGRSRALDLLERGEIDLVLGFVGGPQASLTIRPLYEESHAVVARRGFQGFDGSLKAYLQARHVFVSIGGDTRGTIDIQLQGRGLSRTIAAVFPLYLPALATVGQTDLIATVPRRLAEANAARYGLSVFDPPIELKPFPVQAAWHRRNDKNGGLMWLLDRIAALTAEGTESGPKRKPTD